MHRLLRGLRVEPFGALLGAAAFGLHALHSEVVASVVGRGDLLAFVGGTGATLLLAGAGRGPFRVAAAAASAGIAFGSKESALMFAVFTPVYLGCRARVAPDPSLGSPAAVWRRIGLHCGLALGIPLLAFLILRTRMIGTLPESAAVDPLFSAWRTGVVGLGFGLRQLILPTHLAVDWGVAVWAPVDRLLSGPGLLAMLCLMLPIGLVACGRDPRWRLVGTAFFVLPFVGSNLVVPIGVPYAERLYYPAAIAWALAVGLSADWARQQGSVVVRRTLTGLVAAWLLWSGAWILERAPLWRDQSTLFTHEYRNQPRSARVALNFAAVMRAAGDSDAMLDALERTVTLDPARALAWHEIGVERARVGDETGALAALERALRAERGEGIDPRVIARNHALTLARVDPTRAAREFDRIAGRLDDVESLPWLLDFSQSLERRVPTARTDWPCLRAAICRARGEWKRARPHLRACRGALPNPPPRLVLDLARSELAHGAADAARPLLRAVLEDPRSPPRLREEAQGLLRPLGGQ